VGSLFGETSYFCGGRFDIILEMDWLAEHYASLECARLKNLSFFKLLKNDSLLFLTHVKTLRIIF
jgi:hypothetical protein